MREQRTLKCVAGSEFESAPEGFRRAVTEYDIDFATAQLVKMPRPVRLQVQHE